MLGAREIDGVDDRLAAAEEFEKAGQIPAFELFGITIGPLGVRWYAMAYVLGIVLGWRYAVRLVRNEPIEVQDGPSIHDCMITKSYVIVMDLPVTFSMPALALQRSGCDLISCRPSAAACRAFPSV